MKIVHICQYYNDGYGYQENLLPRYQAKLGHDVVVITSDRKSYFTGEGKPKIVGTGEFSDQGIRIVRLPISSEFKGRYVRFENLTGILGSERPDYIFHHGLTSPSLITSAQYKLRNPSVFLVADNHADLNISARNVLWRITYYRAYWTSILKKWIKYVDLVFGVTPARCYFAEEELGVPHSKVRLLPIGADEDGANAVLSLLKAQDNEVRNKSDILEIATGGKWFKGKGLEELVQAVRGLNVRLKIFGKTDDSFTKEFIDKASDNVSFVGWQDRKGTLQLLRNADLAIWPRQHTTLVEDAVATRTPLILRYHGSTSHFIRGNGAYLFSGQSHEIRQLLDMLSKSRGLVESMKSNAAKILDLLSYKRVAEESLEYYENQDPKTTHSVFMNDPLCNPRNEGFYRLK